MLKSKQLKLFFVLLVIFLLSTTITAVPANPNPFTLTQPDGTAFTAKLIGDERSYRVETINGYTILQDSSDYWTYVQNINGILMPSSYRVGLSNPSELGVSQHLKSTVRREVIGEEINYPAIGEYDISAYAVMNGSKKAIVILINFTSMYNSSSTNISIYTGSYYTNLIFNMSNNMSMNRYYNETSRGMLIVNGSVVGNKWYTSNYSESYWGEDSTSRDNANDCKFNLVKEALIKANDDINYSQYDTNSNGKIESGELAIIVVHAGCSEDNSNCPGWSTRAIWAHAWTIYGSNYGTGSFLSCTPATFLSGSLLQDLILDGVRMSANSTSEWSNCGLNCVGKYTMLAESSPMGTYAHEYGHFLGLPDLYDTDIGGTISEGIGEWGLMGSGSWLGGGVGVKDGTSPAHFSPWSKYFLGWITPIKINSSTLNVQVIQVETNGSVYMIFNNPNDTPGNLDWTNQGTGTGEYFLVENRQRTSFDSSLPGTGLLIWHVDETRGNNKNESRRLVDVEEAHDGVQNLDLSYTLPSSNRGDAGDPFYSPNKTSFTCTSNPNSSFYNNSCQFNITDISLSSNIIPINVMVAGTSVASVAGECYCSNCSDCTSKLNNNSCSTVKLTSDIINYAGTCIYDPANFTSKTFDCQSRTIDGDDSGIDNGIFLNGKSSNIIKNCVITDFSDGIYLYFSPNNNLINNIVNSNTGSGILLLTSPNNTLTSNIANSNGEDGIWLATASNNIMTSNTVNLNTQYGIHLSGVSDNNTFTNNIANSNNHTGVYLTFSSNNIIVSNTINLNTQYGIYIGSGTNNTITNNTINSSDYGIFSYTASNFTINSNIVCNNTRFDFNSSSWGSSTGDNNTCDKPDGWNDAGTTGCTYACGLAGNPINLTGSVTPSSGNLTTLFNYTATYTNSNNTAPAYVNVTIDGTSRAMAQASASDTTYTDGKIYYYNTTLSIGTHTYSFSASDGTYSRSTSTYSGPTVSGLGNVSVVNCSGGDYYIDNGIIAVGFDSIYGITWLGGSNGSTITCSLINSYLNAPPLYSKENIMGNVITELYRGNLHVYDEDFAIFANDSVDYADMYLEQGTTNSIYEDLGTRGTIKQVRNGTVSGQSVTITRYITIRENERFVTVRVDVRNNGNASLNNVELYEYMDIDLYDYGNDKIRVPLASGASGWLSIEETFNSSQLNDNWVYQVDLNNNTYDVGLLTRSAQDITKLYITRYAYYGAEELPYKSIVNGEDISGNDTVWSVGWTKNIPVNGTVTVYYGLAVPENITDLMSLSNLFTSEGITLDLNAPSQAYNGTSISVSASVTNLNNETKNISVTLNLPTGFNTSSPSPKLSPTLNSMTSTQYVMVASQGTGTVTWSVNINANSFGDFNISANISVGNQTDSKNATIKILPGTVQRTLIRAGTLTNDTNVSVNIALSDVTYAYGLITQWPTVDLAFVNGVETLIAYPYGCGEQRISRLLADVQIWRYLEVGNINVFTSKQTELERDITGGSGDIVDLQHDDCGWGWYPSYSSTPFFTNYILTGLLEVDQWYSEESKTRLPTTGGRLMNNSISCGICWLVNNQTVNGSWLGVSPDYVEEPVQLTAYILISLAKAQNRSYTCSNLSLAINRSVQYLKNAQNTDGCWGNYPRDNQSDPYPTAVVMYALALARENISQGYFQNATNCLIQNKTSAGAQQHYWQRSYSTAGWYGHIAETTAYSIMALVRANVSVNNTNVSYAFNYLLANNDKWLHESTKDAATTIWMFNEMYQAGLSIGGANTFVQKWINNVLIESLTYTAATTSAQTVDISNYLNTTNRTINITVNMTSNGTGRITYEIKIYYFNASGGGGNPSSVLSPEGNSWILNVPEKSVDIETTNVTWTLNKTISSPIPAGGVGTVILRLTPQSDIRYVLVNDYIPSGFTLNASYITSDQAYETSSDGTRVSFPIENISSGLTKVIQYGINAPNTTMSNITVRAAEAFLLYEPSVTTSSGAPLASVSQTLGGTFDILLQQGWNLISLPLAV